MDDFLFKKMAMRVPDLRVRLMRARIPDAPEFYLKKTSLSSLFLAAALSFITFMFVPSWQTIVVFPFFLGIAFFYFYHAMDFTIKKLEKDINKELVFAGRFLIIELQSGIPLYRAFENMAKNYAYAGLYFAETIEKINLGTAMDDALSEVAESCPSNNLRKILWQIQNSLKTGSDVAQSLTSVVDQLVREQQILVKEYGKKLNPLAMFYMMVAIIVPTLGMMMAVVLATFLGFTLSLTVLLIIAGVIGFMQFMFLGVIKSNRPPVDM